MPGTRAEDGIRLDPIEVHNPSLRVTREVTLQGSGLIVTHRIRPTAATPVEFRISDGLAARLDIDELGFHPDFEPTDGRIDAQSTVIEGTVKPGQEQTVVSGLCLAQPRPPERIRSHHESVHPTIETSAGSDSDESVPTASLRSSNRRVSTSSSASAGPPTIFARLKRRLWGGKSGGSAESEGTESSANIESEERGPQRGGSEAVNNDIAMASRGGEAETTSDGGRPAAAPDADGGGGHDPRQARSDESDDGPHSTEQHGSASESESAPADSGDSSGAEPWPGLEFESDALAAADEEYRTFAEIFRGIEAVEPEGEEGDTNGDAELDIVSRLLDRFEGDEWPAAKRRCLARQLLAAPDREGRPASVEARLQALEAETRAVSDHAEILESVIDTHGTAEEYLGEVKAELDELDAAKRRIRSRIGEAEAERVSFTDRLSTIEERIAKLESALERLEDREASLRSSQELKYTSLETEEAQLESIAEGVDEMVTEVRVMQETLDRWESRRRALVRALATDR